MKKLVLVLTLLMITSAFAQVETSTPRSYAIPQFYFNALNFAGDMTQGESRVDIYIQVPYEYLQFVKEGDYYVANYEITVNVSTLKGKYVTEKAWTQKVVADNFDQTISRAFWDISQAFLNLPFGDYKITVQVMDLDTKRGFKKEGIVSVRNFAKNPITISDLMMVSSVKSENGIRTIIPNVSNTVTSAENKNFYLFFEVYNNTDVSDSINITYKITKIKKRKKEQLTVHNGTTSEFIKPGKNSIILEIKEPQLGFGDYTIFVEVRMSSNRDYYSVAQCGFIVRWHEIPELITDLDKAIEQLVYIAKPEELNYIKSAQDEIEKEKRFLEFWRKKDPTPNTLKNELMEEYYGRVKYANEHFGHYIEGWKTDMGMVYIIFGPPNSVDRHPFDIDSKPYEIWYYYEINRRFIFLDETGFGDYRLITPLWDEWTRNIWR
ncbi:GWxTD domain-containing protein [Candidatus Kryptobacter tengchongensis]|nr:GWxTD domain-containing protein [Candidatus Kryptobacter tengchongensis]CUS78461.1 GWxTD domain-containing protein [Candidatus Kryptobacter tengchongensis]